MRNPKTTRKMSDFRIFCELLAKMMPGTIDFTIVFREYRRNEKPEKLGIVTLNSSTASTLSSGRKEKPEVV